MSSTHSSSPISTVKSEQPQLARRRSGSPEQNWMARAAQHAAIIIQAATYWEMPISTMIQDFGHHSPSQGASPTFPQPDTPVPLPIPPPQEVIYITIPLQSDSPAYTVYPPHQPNYPVLPLPIQSLDSSRHFSQKLKTMPLPQSLHLPFHSPYTLAQHFEIPLLHLIMTMNPNLESTQDSCGMRI
jgi:hypothetical protein